jgi:cell division protein ZapA
MDSSRVVTIEIQGLRYPIRSELDEQYVVELARYVDGKMARAGHEVPTGESLKIAVLAALNIADELFRSRQDAGGETARLMARAAEIERLVDAALDAARTEASVADAARSGAGARAGRSNAL